MSSPLAKYKLSKQEQQVLLLTMAGHQDKDVAERLGLQIDTIRVYWKRIRAKTQRATRAEVITLMASESSLSELQAAQTENEVLLAEISRRRSVEEELVLYREVFSRTCVGLAIDGGEGAALLRLNEAFADLHGYAPDELVGRRIEMLFAPPERAVADQVKTKVDAVGSALLREKHLRKDGSTFPVLKQITSIPGAKGRIRFRIYTVIDLENAQTWQQFVVGAEEGTKIAAASAS